ncbi:MAG: 2-C-methyl-D-erythritol 4-phosphate cytidylyltransferase [Nitrospira sp.]|nr:2-C-methyl-D-erythritol 4-phosphate cytidylyltransferase [Nitrospira sp.]MDH5253323.1 2-C-methyl-D-erythritol 4-phosphate cytidylyltransferase [Nitrospira sp.]MDH5626454.1 2-C-methyl-D-erythritol 4-phosphate cytidylyltransferase [Nitrospira sp.]
MDQTDARSRQTPLVVALVPAAGRGLRMGGSVPKQFLALGGEPLVVHSLRVLQASPVIDQIVMAVPQADLDYCLNDLAVRFGFSKITKVVPGGKERQDSVRHALEHVSEETDIVVVHDAVRPFLTEKMVAEVVDAARRVGGAIVALPMRDTVKEVGAEHRIERTVDRRPLWLAQTPQAFRRDQLLEAHRKAHAEGVHATDDAFLFEWAGYPVMVVEGSGENVKVTRPEDMIIGEAILAARKGR